MKNKEKTSNPNVAQYFYIITQNIKMSISEKVKKSKMDIITLKRHFNDPFKNPQRSGKNHFNRPLKNPQDSALGEVCFSTEV